MAKRQVLEIHGVSHAAPIPMGVRKGNMVFSSGIMGMDPDTGEIPEDADRQAQLMFQHIGAMMQQAGGSPADITHVTVFVVDDAYRDAVNREWLKMFPDEDDRPARHAVQSQLRRGMKMQCEIVAVLD